VIKVFTQIELGRFTIVTGRTALDGLNQVPGPRWRVNWILWYWLLMFLVSIAQLGGIVGGVGQALSISSPLTVQGRAFNQYQDALTRRDVAEALMNQLTVELDATSSPESRTGIQERIERLDETVASLERDLSSGAPADSHDDIIWAALVTLVTAGMLFWGRYGLIQSWTTFMVAGFTLLTIGNLVHLQTLPEWRVGLSDIVDGLSFRLPPSDSGLDRPALATALAAFGIIGVGATELIQYPYWCREKGYARWAGVAQAGEAWMRRARGWLRVMQWDAWCSAVVYTFATVAFYLLGAAVLGRVGLLPEGTGMVRTLAEMYVPVFGEVAQAVFLIGAVAVLYSTFFVANASHARVCADALRVFGLISTERSQAFWQKVFSGLFPILCLAVYFVARRPVQLILASGVMQALMLPMLGAAALFFRYRLCDPRLRPGKLWDVFLWLSFAGLLVAGGWLALSPVVGWFF
jgi:hypothetical protein